MFVCHSRDVHGNGGDCDPAADLGIWHVQLECRYKDRCTQYKIIHWTK